MAMKDYVNLLGLSYFKDKLTKKDVGLDQVDNTSDANKPVSTLQAEAIVDAKSAGTVAQQSLTNHINNKENPHVVTKAQIGLGNVNNTSDTSKPVSEAQAVAIADAKKAGTDAQSNLDTHIEDTDNPHSVTKAQVGLGNVPNVTTNDQTPSYTEATSLSALTSGEKLSVAFGKISKAVTDLIAHIANKSNPHGVTASQISAVPTSRTVNGKALSANITLSASDVNADSIGSASAVQTSLDEHIDDGDVHITTTERATWNSKADAGHTHTVDSALSSTSTNPVQNKVVNSALSGKVPTTRTINNKALSSNISLTASDVGADASGTASSAVSTHNTSGSAHSDIRDLISALTTKVNNFLDVDDTTTDQLSEVIALIESNQDLIESITTNKVNVSDIVDNLTTSNASKPLSANQGVVIKGLVDALQTAVDGKASTSSLTSHTGNTTVHITAAERTAWNKAEANQNAFSKVTVGSTTVEADTTTDTLTLAGENVTITPDTTNDKITIKVASGSTSTAGIVKLTNSTSSTSTTTAATPSSVKSAYDLANTAKTNAATAQSAADAAQSTADSKIGSVSLASGTTNGTLKLTVDGTASDDITAYTHPTTSGNKHIPSGGSSGQVLKYSADGTAAWGTDNDTKVTQAAAITTAGEYPVLLGYSTATTAVTNTVNKTSTLKYNPNTKVLTTTTFKGALSGNADSATKLATARTISLTGDVSGSGSFDGSGNLSITTTVSDNSHDHTITASASDDDIVVLTGTNGTNAVTYSASHATKGPSTTASTTKGATADVTVSGSGATGSIKVPKVTVDKYGHTTGLTEQTLSLTMPTLPTVNNATITIAAGNGLTTGGNFTTNQSSAETITLDVGAGVGIAVAADAVKAKLRSETALTVDSAAATTTSGRVYPVAVDKTGYLAVNVPWTNTTYTFNGAVSTIKDNNLTTNRALVSNSSGKVDVSDVTSTELSYLDGVTSNVQTQLNGKLEKLTYEWNKSYNAGGTAGYLLIGSFPMYDSNLTIDIDSTTTTTYHGTVIIATQNVSETSIGSAHVITVYGDPTGTISDAIRVVWTSGSRNYNVYFVPSTWSKNLIHIRALGNYLENTDESKICTQFTTGTAPTTTSGLTVVNALKSQLDAKASSTHTHSYAGSSSAGGAANSVKTSLTFNNSGSGAASGTTFNGSTARTISYNTIGAAAASHTHTSEIIFQASEPATTYKIWVDTDTDIMYYNKSGTWTQVASVWG